MKAFIAALAVFLFLLGAAVICTVYENDICHKLEKSQALLPSEISPEAERISNKLSSLWERYRFLFRLTVHKSTTDAYEKQLLSLRTAIISGDPSQYLEAKALLEKALSDLKSAVGFSAEAFF